MNDQRKTSRQKTPTQTDQITVRRVHAGDAFELIYPRSVLMRAEDMEEVHAMLKADEIDVAEDELRYLVGGCKELLEAHKLLGDIAAGDKTWDLARGHYGYAYQLGVDAARKARLRGTLPYSRANNRPLHEAGRGLIHSLLALDEPQLARQVVKQLLAWDPTDPLKIKALAQT